MATGAATVLVEVDEDRVETGATGVCIRCSAEVVVFDWRDFRSDPEYVRENCAVLRELPSELREQLGRALVAEGVEAGEVAEELSLPGVV
jgi:hypothetical protein